MKQNVEELKKYYINATKEEIIEDMFLDCCEKDKEIERLNNKIHDISETLNETYNNRTRLRNENNRLNNIINELEKILEQTIENSVVKPHVEMADYILKELQELKGEDK